MHGWHVFWEVFFLLLIWVPVTIMWIVALMDIFSRRDLNGVGKAAWTLVIIVFPLIGLLVYLLARPFAEPTEAVKYRAVPNPAAQRNAYPPPPGRPTGDHALVDQLDRAAALHTAGKLSDDEYQALKDRLLGTGAPRS